MKGLCPAAALVALLLAGCADAGPTGPANLALGEGAFSLVEMMDNDDLMVFMGGGIEDPVVGLAAAESTLLA
jgi:hypothetical protein